MDAAKINAYVDAYYKTNQTHVAWSFWASLVALAIGLSVLVVGVGLALYPPLTRGQCRRPGTWFLLRKLQWRR